MGSAHAPGLKTIEDALEIRRRVLLAFEAAEREEDAERAGRWLTFVVVGGGPTGVELAGALAEIARHTLARDFRRIDPRAARASCCVEGGAARPAGLPGGPVAQRARRSSRRSASRCAPARAVTGVDDAGVAHRRRADSPRAPWSGRPGVAGLAARRARSACRSTAPAASSCSPTSPCPATRRSSSSATSRRSSRTASRCRAWRPAAMQMGAHAAANVGARAARRAARAVPLPGQGLARDDRPRARRSPTSAGSSCRASSPGWPGSAIHIFFLIGFRNRLDGDPRVGLGVLDVRARRAADHGEGRDED